MSSKGSAELTRSSSGPTYLPSSLPPSKTASRFTSWPGGVDKIKDDVFFRRPMTPSQKESFVHVMIKKTKKIASNINKTGLLEKKIYLPIPRRNAIQITPEPPIKPYVPFTLPYPLSIGHNASDASQGRKSGFKPFKNPFSPPPPIEPTPPEELARLWEDYT